MSKYQFAAFMGFSNSEVREMQDSRGSDSDREEPTYTEDDVANASEGMARILKKKMAMEERQKAPPALEKEKVSMDCKVPPNVITKDSIFHSGAHPAFLTRLLNEPSIEMVYVVCKSWQISRRAFPAGPSELVQQMRRYGISHVLTKSDSSLKDDTSKHIYVEFLLDPFYKQKMEEKRKRMEDLHRRRSVNLIATFGKQANSDSESSEEDDGMGDLEHRLADLDVNHGPRLEQMVLNIDDEEIPGFVDERVHFEVVLNRGEDKAYYIQDMYFYIVSIQKQ